MPALSLSFNHLSSNLKQCFSYCCLFPKGYVFDKHRLIELWMAEGYIHPKNAARTRTEDIGSEYFNDLVARFFFESDDNKSYRMHDLIHDLTQSVSSIYCCQVKDNEACSILEQTRHVSLLCKDVEQLALEIKGKAKQIRTLVWPVEHLKASDLAVDRIICSLKYVRVLDLSSSAISKLPDSVKELKLLRYLNLSKTEIRKLPNSICSLYNLQILKLLGCPWLFKLPRDLGNLINLRHLELDEMFWYKSSMLPPRMGRLTGLHNLHTFCIGHTSGYKIEELKNMQYLTGTLSISKLENAVNAREANLQDKERIQKVVYEWSNRDSNSPDEEANKEVLEGLQPHSNVKELRICHYRGTKFPTWIENGWLRNLVTLSLNHCTRCKILSLGELEHLRELRLKNMQELEEWSEGTYKYSSLQMLKIIDCSKLRKFPCFFSRLRVLKIKKCESIKALPLAPLEFLILVDNLGLEDWHEENLLVQEKNDQGQDVICEISSSSFFLEIKIINCPELRSLPQSFSPQKLEISKCKSLRALPNREHAQRLQVLALDACHDTLASLVPSSGTFYSLSISNISDSVFLPNWPSLPSLKALYIRDCEDLKYFSDQGNWSWQGFTTIRLLSIRNCPKLVTLPINGLPTTLESLSICSCTRLQSFGPKDVLKNLTSLNDLYIEDCPALQSLPEEGLPTSLQHLCIKGCPFLLEQCEKEDGDKPKIKHIPDLEIEIASTKNPSWSSAAAWCHPIRSCTEIDTIDSAQLQQQPNSHSSMQRDKGKSSKGKKVLADASNSIEPGESSKGKKILAGPSSSTENGQSSKGQIVVGETSSSAEHGQSSRGDVVPEEPPSSTDHGTEVNDSEQLQLQLNSDRSRRTDKGDLPFLMLVFICVCACIFIFISGN